MRVLLTGATGHLGEYTLHELLRQGQTVRCLIRDPRAGKRLTRLGTPGKVEIALGDVRDEAALARAMDETGCSAASRGGAAPGERSATRAGASGQPRRHTSAPPRAATPQPHPAKLIYISTVALFGNTQALPPPRRASDPIAPIDPYSQHKAECESACTRLRPDLRDPAALRHPALQ